jgi:hypothetical protein
VNPLHLGPALRPLLHLNHSTPHQSTGTIASSNLGNTSKIPYAARYPAARHKSFGNGAEPPLQASSEPSLLARSILDLDEGYADVEARRTGLSIPHGISFDLWRELGCRVAVVANCSAWWLGDWLLYGEQTYGDRYKQAITDTSLSYQTLRNYAWVAREFPMSRRRDTLSFGHHVEVAALPEHEQDMWLARAEQLNWSCNRLRRALQAAKLANSRTSGDRGTSETRAVKVEVPVERHERWQSAAEQKNCSMADWIIETLDRVASQELRR